MEALVRHLVTPIVDHPEAVSVRTVDSEAVTILELAVHDDDRDVLLTDNEGTLRAIRAVVSAAAGSKKATVELIGDDNGPGSDEDASEE